MRSLFKFLALALSIAIVGVGLSVAMTPEKFGPLSIFGTLVGAFICALIMAFLGNQKEGS